MLRSVQQPELLVHFLADNLSFQRPSVIAENFKQLNPKIYVALCLQKPYHNRRKSLSDSISEIIDLRDIIVHTEALSTHISGEEVNRIITDSTVAVDRIYYGFGWVFDFKPDCNFGVNDIKLTKGIISISLPHFSTNSTN